MSAKEREKHEEQEKKSFKNIINLDLPPTAAKQIIDQHLNMYFDLPEIKKSQDSSSQHSSTPPSPMTPSESSISPMTSSESSISPMTPSETSDPD
jgi:hypothetical protein